MFLNHTVHHRAQLGVYLRLNGRFTFTPRGEIDIKGKGPMSTYFLLGAR